ncbi:MAG: NHL repeat-containing protein [Candidatus Eisenbacteria bacterium]|uniref:NHL repeat-containing protein n=1 Tax=Eiseniibacteriota bacterium TaxID=2212470 RepID=A0A937X905_UNCEI|nr:NHL repeat-containing protein [Candidatus Eisenbacteria bacterium]
MRGRTKDIPDTRGRAMCALRGALDARALMTPGGAINARGLLPPGRPLAARGILAPRAARALLGAIGAALLLGACGQRMELPPQPETPLVTPEPGTYNLKGVWTLPRPTDLAVFGLYLFVVEENLRLGAYYTTRSSPTTPPMISPFEGLLGPVQVALAKRDSLFVVVADSADMRCKIYYWLGGPPLHSFTDTLWVGFNGLAADADLRIYVADAARNVIQAYDRWGRRLHAVSTYGTGSGYVIAPHGLAHNGTHLVVADTGKNWVQRLRPDATSVAAIPQPIGFEAGSLTAPEDVAVDRYGEFIYVADTGGQRVLKFLTTGALQDTVYSPAKIDLAPPLRAPRHVCSEDSLVFVSDPDADRLLLLELKPL